MVSTGYGFFGARSREQRGSHVTPRCPCWCVQDARSASGHTQCLKKRGVDHPRAATVPLKDLERLAYQKVILKSHQEKSYGQETLSCDSSTVADSHENGDVERAVQSLHGQARTLQESLDIAAGETVDPRSLCLAWLIEHAGTLLNLCHRGARYDGFTAHERVKGRSWKTEFPPFGDVVAFQRKTDCKLERRWQHGVFLGILLEYGTDRGNC